MSNSTPAKMYILLKDSVPTGFAVLGAAHASLACYLEFRDRPAIASWLAGPFRKVICRVNDHEFEAAKAFADRVIMTESALDGAEVAMAFCPREEWPKAFKFYQLYRARKVSSVFLDAPQLLQLQPGRGDLALQLFGEFLQQVAIAVARQVGGGEQFVES